MKWPRSGISARFLVAALAVAGVALGIVAVGVLRVGGEAFEALMMAAGDSADHAREMFDASVTVVFAIAAGVAAVVALGLADRPGATAGPPHRAPCGRCRADRGR